jgi:hypothetical protein
MRGDWRDLLGPTFSLFASSSTLVCCALPALLISIGAGAVMVGLTTAIPGIIWLSAHKVPLFIASGVVLSIAAFLQWQQRNAPCPIDPVKAAACMRLRRINRWTMGLSVVVYLTGLFFAFLWPLIFLD